MAIITSVALALMVQGPVELAAPPQAQVEVGYEELVANDNAAARQAIESSSELESGDPAVLINHGIALARTGNYEAARARFEAAASARNSVELETADGKWVDSRRLARKAIAMLDKGEFARYYALSLR